MAIKLFEGQDSFSLYLHVPFCKVKCTYCDFYSKKSTKDTAVYLDALEHEVNLLLAMHPHLESLPVETIFIGGGTPSVLTIEEWHRVAALIHTFNLKVLQEWTIECNPESFTVEKAKAYLDAGVNRLSFGIQSLDDAELRLIGRAHNAARVHEVLSLDILDEFDAVSGDLIYGLPSQTLETLEANVRGLTAFSRLKHISAYELTIAEGTPLAKNLDNYTLPSDDELVQIHRRVKDLLQETGFAQYEVSNYALPGYESKHNSAYWLRKPYLGLGPAAHSFDGLYRFANAPSLQEYRDRATKNRLPHGEYAQVSQAEALEEFLFLRLRMNRGFTDREFQQACNERFVNDKRKRVIDELLEEEMLANQNDFWFCTDKGLDMVDAIALRLLDE